MREEPVAGLGGAVGERWELRVRDGPGALERVLSVLRRRLVVVETLSMTRAREGVLVVDLRVVVQEESRDRIRSELRNLVGVEVVADAGAADVEAVDVGTVDVDDDRDRGGRAGPFPG